MKWPSFDNVEEFISECDPQESVYCVRPSVLKKNTQKFIKNFDGKVLYALKANPLKPIVDAIYDGGVRHFDTASLNEIKQISTCYNDARTYFMHPVKSWNSIKVAYHQFGVRHYVIDHVDELKKIINILTDEKDTLIIMVRLATPTKDAKFNLSSKFGACVDEVVKLLRAVQSKGAIPGLCFHVGSQCTSTFAYSQAFTLVKEVLSQTNFPLHCLDIGGGFPVRYEGTTLSPLEDYFEVIRDGVRSLNLTEKCDLMCEPGRALVADGMSVLTQVQLRKDDTLYLNDGIYGSLGGARLGLKFPIRVIREEQTLSEEDKQFTIYGPTCDGLDVLPYKIDLPDNTNTGDWIEFGMLGAYGPAIRTDFNGFKPSNFCFLSDTYLP